MHRLLLTIIVLACFVSAEDPECNSLYPLHVGDTLIYLYTRGSIGYYDSIPHKVTKSIDSSYQSGDTTFFIQNSVYEDEPSYNRSDRLYSKNDIIYGQWGIKGFSSENGVREFISKRATCSSLSHDTSICEGITNHESTLFRVDSMIHYDSSYIKSLFSPLSSYLFDSCTVVKWKFQTPTGFSGYYVNGVGEIVSILYGHAYITQELIYSNSPCLDDALSIVDRMIKPIRKSYLRRSEVFDLNGRKLNQSLVNLQNRVVIVRSVEGSECTTRKVVTLGKK